MNTALRRERLGLSTLLFLVAFSGGAHAQQVAVCSNDPGDGERISCIEEDDSTDDIDISLQSGVDITTTAEDFDGAAVHALHKGQGDVTINILGATDSDTISTSGAGAAGVNALARGKGSADVTVTDVEIMTAGVGINVESVFLPVDHSPYDGEYNALVEVSGSTITTTGRDAIGIKALLQGNADQTITGRLGVDVSETTITTSGLFGNGIDALSLHSSGDASVTVTGSTITATGSNAVGVRLRHNSVQDGNDAGITLRNTVINTKTHGVSGSRWRGDGTVTIDAEGDSITTDGVNAIGIYGFHSEPTDINSGDIVIFGRHLDIDTLGTAGTNGQNQSFGIYANHRGEGDIDIDTWGGFIDTGGGYSYGIYASHAGAGDEAGNVDIDARYGRITTQGVAAHAIFAWHLGEGNVAINTWGSSIGTVGGDAYGIYGSHDGVGDETSDVDIFARGGGITTQGIRSHGIFTWHRGEGDIDIETQDGLSVWTVGGAAHGIYAYHGGAGTEIGDIHISAQGGSVTTHGLGSHGVHADLQNSGMNGAGDIDIDIRNATVTTESTDVDPTYLDTFSTGIYARHRSLGDIRINAQGGGITTKGVFSYGIYSVHQGDGDITIGTRDGHTLTTTGAGGHGIVAYHYGAMDLRTIAVNVGGTIDVSGQSAVGVRVGAVNSERVPERVASLDEHGFRRQAVTVDGAVTSAGVGVYLAGGGRVVIGPRGSITSNSGIAIYATGTVPEVPEDNNDPNNVIPAIPAIPPKLRVDLNLGGRQVAQAIYDDWIINDGGETTIAVNGSRQLADRRRQSRCRCQPAIA